MKMKTEFLGNLVTIAKGRKAHNVFLTPQLDAARYIQINDLRTDLALQYTTDKGVFVEHSDICIAWDGANAGTVGHGLTGVIGSTIARLRPTSQRVFSPYLGKFLQSQFAYLNQGTTGATIPHVNRQRLEGIIVPFPSIEEQRRIAAILDKADALRRKRADSLKLADEFLKSVFLDMFGDPVTNEKGWEKDILNNFVSVQGGLQLTPARKNNEQIVPYLRVANVYRGFLDLSEIKELAVTQSEIERCSLKFHDILVVEGHGNPDEIGRCALWNSAIDGCLHQNHLIRLRCDSQELTPVFLEHLINSDMGRIQLAKAKKTTSGLNTISASQLRNLVVLLPSLDLQKKFADIVQKVETHKQRAVQGQQEADDLFKALQQQFFS